jgi:hypothetical protein
MNAWWEKLSADWSPDLKRWVACGISVVAGLLVALVLHYVLYRMGLPSKPFIYVAF